MTDDENGEPSTFVGGGGGVMRRRAKHAAGHKAASSGADASAKTPVTTARLLMVWGGRVAVAALAALGITYLAVSASVSPLARRTPPGGRPAFTEDIGSMTFAGPHEVLHTPECSLTLPVNATDRVVAAMQALLTEGMPCVCTPMLTRRGLRAQDSACMLAVTGGWVFAQPAVRDLNPAMQTVALGGSPACPGRYAEFTTPSSLMLSGTNVPTGQVVHTRIDDAADGLAACVWRCVTAMRTRDRAVLLRPCYAK